MLSPASLPSNTTAYWPNVLHTKFTYCLQSSGNVTSFFHQTLCMRVPPSKTCLNVSFISHWAVIKWLRKATLSGLYMIPCLNKDIAIVVISYSKSFSTSSSHCASAVSLVKIEVGFRLIYFPCFITTILYKLSIG